MALIPRKGDAVNIDLLFTSEGEAGLVSDTGLDHPVAGIMYDALTGLLALEFADTDSMELNIPVEQSAGDSLLHRHDLHAGIIQKGVIADGRQVPLVLINDPFGGGNTGAFAVRPRKSLAAFENFMKRCISGQPVHRADLGNEDKGGSILGGINPAVLEFAPHLARQRTLEASPHLAPQHAPPGLGLGGNGGGAQRARQSQQQRRNAQSRSENGEE
ncbi:MAG: hypothetical protein HY370_02110 [Proteobacteria bacterium]|nr:hypothetical protein [Pseudomonadota bacterium]